MRKFDGCAAHSVFKRLLATNPEAIRREVHPTRHDSLRIVAHFAPFGKWRGSLRATKKARLCDAPCLFAACNQLDRAVNRFGDAAHLLH
jgi:hypothetical protein